MIKPVEETPSRLMCPNIAADILSMEAHRTYLKDLGYSDGLISALLATVATNQKRRNNFLESSRSKVQKTATAEFKSPAATQSNEIGESTE